MSTPTTFMALFILVMNQDISIHLVLMLKLCGLLNLFAFSCHFPLVRSVICY